MFEQPLSATGPFVGSAVMLNRFAPSLRDITGAPPCMPSTRGTSVAVVTITLIGVAYFVQSAFDVSNVIMSPLTLALHAVRAWR